MLEKIFQLIEIGKELGLSKKEINKVLIFGNSKHKLLYKSLLIISFIFFGILILILGIEASRNTYAAGTFYSTVKIKDYKTKKWKFKIQIRRDYLENDERYNSAL